jgi:type VI secretion system secreted protein Hcp
VERHEEHDHVRVLAHPLLWFGTVSRFHRSPRRIVAVDYFLKIDGVPGESSDAKHKGEIQLDSFGWGETSPGGAGPGGGVGAGKVQMQDLVVTMAVSKASPKLMLACATGKHHKEAVLTARRAAGKAQQEFLVFKFKEVVVTSYQLGGSELGDAPMDQVSLGFSTIQMEYSPQKADGSLDTPVKAGWDLKQNKAI